MSAVEITMKLLIDKKSNKVLFAEAGKECADFFFHILALPIGAVVKCLSKGAMVGSLGTLYDSLENLSNDYLQANVSKDHLLNPRAPIGISSHVPLLAINQAPESAINEAPETDAKNFRTCNYSYNDCPGYVSDGIGAVCPRCAGPMSRALTYIAPPAVKAKTPSGEGYVKGVVTYMIMDDLVVKPMSTISSITLLNKFNIKDVGCLEENLVNLDMKQGMALLKASLMSKTVLTDVFLGNKGI